MIWLVAGSQHKEEEQRSELTSDKENSRKGSKDKDLIIEDVAMNEDNLRCKEVTEDGFAVCTLTLLL